MGGGGRGVIGNGNERGGAEAEGYKEGPPDNRGNGEIKNQDPPLYPCLA